MILIISSSLRPASNSRLLAQHAQAVLARAGHETDLLDLRDFPLPLCDAAAAYGDPNVAAVNARLARADGFLVATPIYNYDATGALKNLIELTGDAWENKVVGFLCAAGGMSSYMSIMSLANSLMLDFRCVIMPRFVYATADAFGTGMISDPDIQRRVEELTLRTARLSGALKLAA